MLKLRMSLVLLLLWLVVVNNIERIHKPINLASFVYVLTGILAMAVACVPRVRKLRLAEVTAVSCVVFVILKWSLGYTLLGSHLPVTVTECLVIVLTNLLAWRVARGIYEFEQHAGEVVAMQLGRQPVAFENAESEMYQEVQRARRFERGLSVATVAVDKFMDTAHVNRLLGEVRQELVRKYLESRLAKLLMAATSPCDLVAYREREFVLLFPETEADAVRALLHQVAADAREELGLRLQVGVAEFPDQECTLAGLVERAESEMCVIGERPVATNDPVQATPAMQMS